MTDRPVRVFYRIIKGNEARREHFLSDREAGKSPPADPSLLDLHDGLSVYDSEAGARRTALKWPKIVDHIAELVLTETSDVSATRTGYRGHYTLKGNPDTLLAAVRRVIPVSRESAT